MIHLHKTNTISDHKWMQQHKNKETNWPENHAKKLKRDAIWYKKKKSINWCKKTTRWCKTTKERRNNQKLTQNTYQETQNDYRMMQKMEKQINPKWLNTDTQQPQIYTKWCKIAARNHKKTINWHKTTIKQSKTTTRRLKLTNDHN